VASVNPRIRQRTRTASKFLCLNRNGVLILANQRSPRNIGRLPRPPERETLLGPSAGINRRAAAESFEVRSADLQPFWDNIEEI